VEDISPRAAAPESPATAPTSTTGAAARRLGRATGAASVSGRQAVAKHRPEAEKQVKRAIRGAGRISGRLASPAAPDRRTAPDRPAGPSAGPSGD